MKKKLDNEEVADHAQVLGDSWQVWALVVVAVIGLVSLVVWSDIRYHWSGFYWYTIEPTRAQLHAGEKKIWDWLELLIVPAVIAVSALIYGSLERRNEQIIAENRRKADRRIAEEQLSEDRRIADERAQDAALQAYLEQMSALLLNQDLRTSGNDTESRAVARAWTLTILRRLTTGERKGVLLRFLYEADLIMQVNNIVSLETAVLWYSELWRANLRLANLRGTYLTGANLEGADLEEADLWQVNLKGANLKGTHLKGASLEKANFQGANLLGADLQGANLQGALYNNITIWPDGFTPPDTTLNWDQLSEEKREALTKEQERWYLQNPSVSEIGYVNAAYSV